MYSGYSNYELEHVVKIIEKLFDCKFNEFFNRLEKGLEEDSFIDTKEACKLLGITRVTLHNWVKGLCVPYLKKGGRYYFNKLHINNLIFYCKSKGLSVRKPDSAAYEYITSRHNNG